MEGAFEWLCWARAFSGRLGRICAAQRTAASWILCCAASALVSKTSSIGKLSLDKWWPERKQTTLPRFSTPSQQLYLHTWAQDRHRKKMSAQAAEGINPLSEAPAVCSIHHISIGHLKQAEFTILPCVETHVREVGCNSAKRVSRCKVLMPH